MSESPKPIAATGGGARQLLGMKGASGTTNIWKIRLQLMKPVTWIPLIWGSLWSRGLRELPLDRL